MRYRLLSIVAVLALAGCGGESATGESGASVAPADALGFIEIQADLESGQWEQVQELLDRFPDRPQLIERLNEELREHDFEYERDVEPALGDTVVLVWANGADSDDVVLLTQPDDDDKFEALVGKMREEFGDDFATGEVDGWRAASERAENIDAIRDGGGSLADVDAFEAARAQAPEERLAFAFMRAEFGEGLGSFGTAVKADWASGSIEARDDGAAVTIALRGEDLPAGGAYDSARVDEAPGDALAFLSFDGASLRSQSSMLAPLAAMLGVRIDELLEGLDGEAALWVRPGVPIPEVTLVVETDDPDDARAALETLLRGVPVEVKLGVVDGRLVVTTGPSPEAALEARDETLGESEDFREAVEAAGMPDETSGFLYVNVADALPLLGLAGLAGADVPEELLANLRPIRSVVAWSETDDGTSTQTVFVEIQ